MTTKVSEYELSGWDRDLLLEIPESLRSDVAYGQKGNLLVNRGNVKETLLNTFIERLKERGQTFKVRDVSRHQLKEYGLHLQEDGSGRSNSELSEQEQVMVDLIEEAVSRDAADIHIRVLRNSKDQVEIWFREHNDLKAYKTWPVNDGVQRLSSFYESLSEEGDTHFRPFRTNHSARVSDDEYLPESVHGLRIESNATPAGFTMVIRLFYEEAEATGAGESLDLTDLGYTDDQTREIQRMKNQPEGLILFVGPTSSGKSTSEIVLLKQLLEESGYSEHIITAEDPPENDVYGMDQININDFITGDDEGVFDRSKAYAKAIRSMLRMDPDVLMVGEIRDEASAKKALTAAETGHVVFSTLHATSAIGTITRLTNQGVSPFRLARENGLVGVVHQKLIPVLCDSCKQPLDPKRHTPSGGVQKTILPIRQLVERNGSVFVRNTSGQNDCSACRGTGIGGRTLVAETFRPNKTARQYMKQDSMDELRTYWMDEMDANTIDDHAVYRVMNGQLDPFDAQDELGYANDV